MSPHCDDEKKYGIVERVVERVIDKLNLRERIPGLAGSPNPHRALLGSIIYSLLMLAVESALRSVFPSGS